SRIRTRFPLAPRRLLQTPWTTSGSNTTSCDPHFRITQDGRVVAALAVTAAWALVLLERTLDGRPALRWIVLALGCPCRDGDRRRRAPIPEGRRRGGCGDRVGGTVGDRSLCADDSVGSHTGSLPTTGPAGDGTDPMGPQGGQGGQGTGTTDAELTAALQDTDTGWPRPPWEHRGREVCSSPPDVR